MSITAYTNGTVYDGTGRAIPGGTVLIEDGRFLAVGPSAEVPVPSSAEVVDLRGRFVIPGLLDANVHLCIAITPDLILEFEGRYEQLVEEAAQVTLKAGVTTVFDTWDPLAPVVAVRDRIAAGEIPGSRVYTGGNIIGYDGPLSKDFYDVAHLFGADARDRLENHWVQGVGGDLIWLTPDEVAARVREYIERTGVDFIKYGASGHSTREMRFITFSDRVQRAIVAEAHRAGITAQSHTTSPESLWMAIAAGVDLLQHGDITGRRAMPRETVEHIAERGIPVAALLHTRRFHEWVKAHASEDLRDYIYNDEMVENQRNLIAAGAKLLLTTDGGVFGPRIVVHPLLSGRWEGVVDSPANLGESHFFWLEAAIELGAAPMEVLQMATRHPAAAYGVADRLGTIEPGKFADLVVLDADPLADPANYRRISSVVKDGVVVDRDALPLTRILTA
jgi:imidazolonepropionase-like amidohydrolase